MSIRDDIASVKGIMSKIMGIHNLARRAEEHAKEQGMHDDVSFLIWRHAYGEMTQYVNDPIVERLAWDFTPMTGPGDMYPPYPLWYKDRATETAERAADFYNDGLRLLGLMAECYEHGDERSDD